MIYILWKQKRCKTESGIPTMVSDPIKDWRSENRSDEQGVHKPLKKSDVWIVSVVVALGDPENVGEVWVTVRLLVVCGGWLQSMEKWIPSC